MKVARVLSLGLSAMASVSRASSSEMPGLNPMLGLQRLAAVPGSAPEKVNDLLLLRPRAPAEPEPAGSSRHAVFFHGDIQNFQDEMSQQSDAAPWLRWSLEQVALTLSSRFPDHHVWVVRASRMYLHKFSCYHNFVQSNMFGAPEHSEYPEESGLGAFHHLRNLLSHGMRRAELAAPLLPPEGAVPAGFSLALVGFSKGCVVLNQLVYELAGARADQQMAPFVRSISDMFWLDGGHPGGSETWVTDKPALSSLATSGVRVHAHVTPYEVCDPMRAWVGREHAHFIQTLEELGASPQNTVHFADEPPSISNHFRVLLEF
ncbi:mitochondrial protein C2orf69 homolog [Synchiropus splendidus]|uniref:mitochondrial protein C2orf69 homolog n=1 Tax=Synchiropus splendidus TaxID=270530 RepID=UPI00237DBBAE|nr:mitochondrial protein C2orf69 homolog [Synchiropus splendidus]